MSSNPVDGAQIANFSNSLDRHQKALLLLGRRNTWGGGNFASPLINQLPLSLATRFLSTAGCKIWRIRMERLCELEAP